jgi:hypothetical protein
MTPSEFSAELTRLGLHKGHAARVLGTTRRTLQRYCDGSRRPPQTLLVLLALLAGSEPLRDERIAECALEN